MTRTKSAVFMCKQGSIATTSSSIRLLSSRLIGAQKNGLQWVRESLSQPIRETLAARARSWMRRPRRLSRFSHAPREMQNMRREERKTPLLVGQPKAHLAICHADRWIVPCDDNQGRGAADASRLAYRQRAGQSLYAQATRACRASDAERHRRRRSVDQEAACVSDSRQRSGAETRDLVRR